MLSLLRGKTCSDDTDLGCIKVQGTKTLQSAYTAVLLLLTLVSMHVSVQRYLVYSCRTCQQQYDVILASFAMHHLSWEHKNEFLGHLSRMLKLGGCFCLIDVFLEEGKQLRLLTAALLCKGNGLQAVSLAMHGPISLLVNNTVIQCTFTKLDDRAVLFIQLFCICSLPLPYLLPGSDSMYCLMRTSPMQLLIICLPHQLHPKVPSSVSHNSASSSRGCMCVTGQSRTEYMEQFVDTVNNKWTEMDATQQQHSITHVTNHDFPVEWSALQACAAEGGLFQGVQLLCSSPPSKAVVFEIN